MSEASNDQGAVRAVEPPSEPKTPMWLPALGAALFVVIGLWWATSPPPPPPPAPAAEAASGSAAASAPAPPPAPSPTTVATLGAPTMPSAIAIDGGTSEAVQRLLEGLRKRQQQQPH